MPKLIPVILSGGSGARLWPASRASCPKPFMRIGEGPSLLHRVVERCAPLSDGSVMLVTNQSYAFRTRQEAEAVPAMAGLQLDQVLEPCPRNTAGAIACAVLAASAGDEDPTLLVLPADQLIGDPSAFLGPARRAARLAESGEIVLFGIAPTSPETGFGYLELGDLVSGAQPGDAAYSVAQFVEKPALARAEEFVASGSFVWNSGMFCFKASTMLAALAEHAPDVLAAASKAWAEGQTEGTNERDTVLDEDLFGLIPDISIDCAVMERSDNAIVLRASFPWSDIGSWKSLSQHVPHDEAGNTIQGEGLLVDSRNTYIHSEQRVIAGVGLDDLVVVDTPDALLVAHKESSQQVREVVARLKERGHEAVTLHRTVSRPWGTYTTLHEGQRSKIKEIVVRPGETLSLQMHYHRSEHWIVVSGSARVTCGDDVRVIYGNESTYIPVGTKHRLENPGKVDLVLIEVQSGDYVGEDDIVRFDDRNGRAPVTSDA